MRVLRCRTQKTSLLWPTLTRLPLSQRQIAEALSFFTFCSGSQSWYGMEGPCASKEKCGRARITFAVGRGHKSPFPNSLPLLASRRENAEQKHKRLAEGPEDQHQRWHIAKGRTEVGSSCSLQGVEKRRATSPEVAAKRGPQNPKFCKPSTPRCNQLANISSRGTSTTVSVH